MVTTTQTQVVRVIRQHDRIEWKVELTLVLVLILVVGVIVLLCRGSR